MNCPNARFAAALPLPPRALAPLALLALLGSLAACGGNKPAPPAASAAPQASYTVRGEIVRLPGPDSAEVLIRHEPIPDFKNPAGEVVGMDSMTMPFRLAAGESLEGLAVGARVEFRLEMRWSGGAPATVSAFTALPPGTRLSFDPPAPESPGASA
ncbi:MAG: copper-binding protein, partial [Thermoanaerobaculia bacterium]